MLKPRRGYVSQPNVAVSATLGLRGAIDLFNRTAVVPFTEWPNRVAVGFTVAFPRVAEAQPWAVRRNPFGV